MLHTALHWSWNLPLFRTQVKPNLKIILAKTMTSNRDSQTLDTKLYDNVGKKTLECAGRAAIIHNVIIRQTQGKYESRVEGATVGWRLWLCVGVFCGRRLLGRAGLVILYFALDFAAVL